MKHRSQVSSALKSRQISIAFVFLNPFIPEFLKWTLPILSQVETTAQISDSFKNQTRMANKVDPDGTAHYEPSHQDLHCLQKKMFWSIVWSAGLKWLSVYFKENYKILP